mgnify:CR=1 FL=1
MINYYSLSESRTDNNILGNGAFGTVYRFNQDTCFKIMDTTVKNQTVLKLMRTLPLEGIVNIKDFIDKSGKIIGYTMDLINKEDINLLTVDINYLIQSYLKLKKDIILLSNEHIRAIDLYPRNIIISNNGIRLVDLDLYKFEYSNDLLMNNSWSLKYLFELILGSYIPDDYYEYFESVMNTNEPLDDSFITKMEKSKNLRSFLGMK